MLRCRLCKLRILKIDVVTDKVGLFSEHGSVPFTAIVHKACFDKAKKDEKYKNAVYEPLD